MIRSTGKEHIGLFGHLRFSQANHPRRNARHMYQKASKFGVRRYSGSHHLYTRYPTLMYQIPIFLQSLSSAPHPPQISIAFLEVSAPAAPAVNRKKRVTK